MHGADENYHCNGLSCDKVVTFDRMPDTDSKKTRVGFTFQTPASEKEEKLSPAESRRRTEEGKAILAGMRQRAKRSRASMAYKVIPCTECGEEFKRKGTGQALRTKCYSCKPKEERAKPSDVARSCALSECDADIPPGDARRAYCCDEHKTRAANRRTAERRKISRAEKPKDPKKLEKAVDWLRELLETDGPTIASDVISAGSSAGHSKTTIHTATKVLEVRRTRGELGSWWWSLPPESERAAVNDDEEPLVKIACRRAIKWLRFAADKLEPYT